MTAYVLIMACAIAVCCSVAASIMVRHDYERLSKTTADLMKVLEKPPANGYVIHSKVSLLVWHPAEEIPEDHKSLLIASIVTNAYSHGGLVDLHIGYYSDDDGGSYTEYTISNGKVDSRTIPYGDVAWWADLNDVYSLMHKPEMQP